MSVAFADRIAGTAPGAADGAPRLWQLLQERARLRPEGIAFRAKHRGLWRPESWRALHDAASRLAMALTMAGAVPGDRIAVLLSDEASWFRAALAVAALGGVLATLPEEMPQERVIERLASASRAWLVTDRADLLAGADRRGFGVRRPGVLSPALSPDAPLLAAPCETAMFAVEVPQREEGVAVFGEQQLFDLARVLLPARSPSLGGHLVVAAPASSLDGLAARLVLALTSELVVCLPEAGVQVLDTLRDVQPQVVIATDRQWEAVWREISLCRLEAAPSHRRLFDFVTGSRRPPAWSPARLLDNLLARHVGLRNCRLAVATGAAVGDDVRAFYARLSRAFEQPGAARRPSLESELRSLPMVIEAVLGHTDAAGRLDIGLTLDAEAALRFGAASGLELSDAAAVAVDDGLRHWLSASALRLCAGHPRLAASAVRLRLTI